MQCSCRRNEPLSNLYIHECSPRCPSQELVLLKNVIRASIVHTILGSRSEKGHAYRQRRVVSSPMSQRPNSHNPWYFHKRTRTASQSHTFTCMSISKC